MRPCDHVVLFLDLWVHAVLFFLCLLTSLNTMIPSSIHIVSNKYFIFLIAEYYSLAYMYCVLSLYWNNNFQGFFITLDLSRTIVSSLYIYIYKLHLVPINPHKIRLVSQFLSVVLFRLVWVRILLSSPGQPWTPHQDRVILLPQSPESWDYK